MPEVFDFTLAHWLKSHLWDELFWVISNVSHFFKEKEKKNQRTLGELRQGKPSTHVCALLPSDCFSPNPQLRSTALSQSELWVAGKAKEVILVRDDLEDTEGAVVWGQADGR